MFGSSGEKRKEDKRKSQVRREKKRREMMVVSFTLLGSLGEEEVTLFPLVCTLRGKEKKK